ncbi:MAG: response regulator [Acidobacteria bacterium]|nr:response regulator [Acidobacteriota bacterium]MCA1627977.1 response regulator [Acidobacteriota bacterium]
MREKPWSVKGQQAFDIVGLCRYFSELSPQPMVAVEGTSHIVRHLNAAFARLIGKDAAELIGRPFAEAVPEGEENRCLSLLDRVYRTGTPETLVEQEHCHTTPPVYWSYSVWAILGAQEHPIGVIIQVTDTTETAIFRGQVMAMNEQLLLSATRQHELTEIAERANHLKDEFLATLSHELRTPLNAILGWAEVLANSQIDPVISLRAIEVIRRNARMQVQLVDDVLDVSRIITGKLRLSAQPLDLGTIITAAVDGLRPAAEAKEIGLQLQLDSPAGQVSGDPDRLQQVAWNLISNAIKFTPKGGRVLVRLERVESNVEVIVSDTGQGIAPEFLPHVFDRFRQADATTTRAFGGLGLGLAIVRQLVELHGGTVRADSEGEDLGSTFTFSLPLMAGRNAASETENAQAPEFKLPEPECPSELDGLHVLIVDDDVDACELLGIVLRGCGAQVTTTFSAGAALAAIEQEAFDVLISDLGMPDEDGYSLIAKVRALGKERGGEIPAAALTAYAAEGDRIQVLRSGFQIHVPKPVSPTELVAIVARLSGRTG